MHPEVWLRGQSLDPHPLKHLLFCTLEQAREEVSRALAAVPPEKLWIHPHGLTPLGFHIRHLAESLDRLLTYAEGRPLEDAQLLTLRSELDPVPATELAILLHLRLDQSRDRILALNLVAPEEIRLIGRAQIPVPLGSLVAHIAEHTQRHLGQIATTTKLLQALKIQSQ